MFKMVHNEYIEGTEEQRRVITSFLEAARQIKPDHLADHVSLQYATDNQSLDIDWALFRKAVSEATEHFKNISFEFNFIPLDRYYVSKPAQGNIGGFYGAPRGGYFYFNDVGFTTTLDEQQVSSTELRTLELARNYLHDGIHASTYRTFAYKDDAITPVFRRIYGINIRNADGVSYSSPDIDQNFTFGINLNVLMDGANQMQSNKFFACFCDVDTDSFSPQEKAVYDELIGAPFDNTVFPEPKEFYKNVIEPADRFFNNWGESFQHEVLPAMLYGDTGRLRLLLNSQLGRSDAWEYIFKQPTYKDDPEVEALAEGGLLRDIA